MANKKDNIEDRIFSATDIDLFNRLEKIPENEKQVILKQLEARKPLEEVVNLYTKGSGDKKVRFGVISDKHPGSKYFSENLHNLSVKKMKDVDFIIDAGDVIEGMSNREGHIYELKILGVSAQIDYAVELMNQYKKPIYFILGNHTEWSINKSNQGYNPGKDIERRVKDSKYIGDDRGIIELAPLVKIEVTHGGNSAYALSYSLQRKINSMEGGDKSNVLLNGHLHKALYMFYRNVHAFECGTFQSQTPFMRMKGAPAMMGYWIIDLIYNNKNGIVAITPTFYPYYAHGEK